MATDYNSLESEISGKVEVTVADAVKFGTYSGTISIPRPQALLDEIKTVDMWNKYLGIAGASLALPALALSAAGLSTAAAVAAAAGFVVSTGSLYAGERLRLTKNESVDPIGLGLNLAGTFFAGVSLAKELKLIKDAAKVNVATDVFSGLTRYLNAFTPFMGSDGFGVPNYISGSGSFSWVFPPSPVLSIDIVFSQGRAGCLLSPSLASEYILWSNDSKVYHTRFLLGSKDVWVSQAANGDFVQVIDGEVTTNYGGLHRLIELLGCQQSFQESSNSYVMGPDSPNLALTGSNNINCTGNDANNVIAGNDGNNVLDGGAGNDYINGGQGADTLIGGTGDDIYVVGESGDTVLENSGEGNDTIISSIGYTLGANVENLMLAGSENTYATGNEFDNVLIGNDGNNVLSGGAGDDYLDGGLGIDTLVGGIGNDTYVVDNTGDVVVEYSNEGIDFVKATVEYSLGANVENLILLGDDSINGAGNELDNIIIGNGGNNVLDGKSGKDYLDGGQGVDTLCGGTGDDTYVIDNPDDVIIENSDEGSDTVISSISYTLGANLENLVLIGSDSINGIGNELDNVIIGNSANNILDSGSGNDYIDGGKGVDTLIGGLGNDTYVLDNTGDIVVENTNEGNDTVCTTTNYILGANLENLVLFGSSAIDGTGNELDNNLIGNIGNNVLNGGGGDDYIDGDSGNDYLIGGSGNDTYFWGTGLGNDIIDNYATDECGLDTILFGTGLTIDSFDYLASGEDLVLINKDTGEALTIAGWFNGSDSQVEKFQFANGTVYTGQEISSRSTINGAAIIVGTKNSDYLNGVLGQNCTIYGLAGNDYLFGSSGNDVLNGGTGNDYLNGGVGNDNYLWGTGAGNDIIYNYTVGGHGEDTVMFGSGLTIGSFDYLVKGRDLVLKNITTGETLTVSGWFSGLNNQVEKFQFADGTIYTAQQISDKAITYGTAGVDCLYGFAGMNNMIYALDGNDYLYGNNGNDILDGGVGNDYLNGGSGNDYLDGGLGVDKIVGGQGNDTYIIDDLGDIIVENVGEGIDTVESYIAHIMKDNIENLTLLGGDDISGMGNELDNIIFGNNGNNILNGGAGDDILDGGAGNDALKGGLGDDIYIYGIGYGNDVIDSFEGINGNGVDTLMFGSGITSDSLEYQQSGQNLVLKIKETGEKLTLLNWFDGQDYQVDRIRFVDGNELNAAELSMRVAIIGTNSNDILIGNDQDNKIYGMAGNDILNGGLGADIMVGGVGDDTYIVDNAGDIVTELIGEGIDTVQSSISYTLGTNVENLTLTGTADINGTGNELDNIITGNAGNNVLSGGTGNDTLVGGAGNDCYCVDSPTDVVVENADEGIDTVQSSITYTLGANLEKLTLTGVADINGTGNELDNTITGNDGNNILDGRLGADTMYGGAGNDAYTVDNAGDMVVENQGEGSDTVQSSINYILGANVENLTLTNSADNNGKGNELDNIIIGNGGNNILDGGAGADTMTGGAGSDTYVVDNVGDMIVENPGGGIDTVQSGISYALGANVENLILTGSDSLNSTGNELDNTITGNIGNNILDGGLGADIMAGGLGNDTYILDNAADLATELAGEGVDTIQASIAYTLGSNLENLILTGNANLNGAGNELNNIITGNGGSNNLSGGAGKDTLDGGVGNDYLEGGLGDDVYLYGIGSGSDIIESYEGTDGNGCDVVQFGQGIAMDSFEYLKNGQDLVLKLETGETLTLQNWFNGTNYQVDKLVFVDGSEIMAAGIQISDLKNVKTSGGAASDVLVSTSGNNTLSGNDGNDLLFAGSGNDKLYGGAGSDILNSGTGNNTLYGEEGNDQLLGGIGNDKLYGGSGNDTLSGGAGNDYLEGGLGDDCYIFGIGSGKDTIYNNVLGSDSGFDTLLFQNLNMASLKFKKDGSNLVCTITQTQETACITGWFISDGYQIDKFQFSDGSLTVADVNQRIA